MCGICGILSPKGVNEGRSRIAKMLNQLAHRGPDGRGVLEPSVVPQVLLGHVRLSIIAPGEEGEQPMCDRESGNTITFNGEIFNYREIREELRWYGHSFSTHSDTEVLLKAYQRWGAECLNHLNGIYAFAIWDRQKRVLFAARDPLGVKPFYYAEKSGTFVFASEVRAMLASGLLEKHLSRDGLDSLLAYGSVQEPFTLAEGIRSLPAGSHLMLSSNGDLDMHSATPFFANPKPIAEQEIPQLVSTSLASSIRRQLVSDVPLALFLSGGIDSSAVATLASQQQSNLRAFTIVFDEPDLDEREKARGMARSLGLEHHELELTSKQIRANASHALDAQDLPSIDGINSWLVSNLVHEAGIKVALSGLGGDELFGGYGGFYRPRRLIRLTSILRQLPLFLRDFVASYLHNEGLRKLLSAPDFPLSPYFLTRQLMGAKTRSILTGTTIPLYPDWMKTSFAPLQESAPNDAINAISYWELCSYMRSTLLRDADCMGMANALEIRVPLIDVELVKLLSSLPGHLKLSPDMPKPLLVQGAGLDATAAKSPKQGFDLPIQRILQEVLLPEAQELFEAPPDCFDKNALRQAWSLYNRGQLAWQRLWCLFITLRWIRNWM